MLRPTKVVDPVEELTGLPKASHLMKEPSTSKEGFDLLNSMANEGDASAIYLLSRLYFGKMNNEYDPDSIRNMRQVLLDSQLITTDFEKAHALLLKTLEKDPKEYHALFELGRDCLAGNNREHEAELGPNDFKKANEYFTKALKYAHENNDVDYVERINEQMEMIKTVI